MDRGVQGSVITSISGRSYGIRFMIVLVI